MRRRRPSESIVSSHFAWRIAPALVAGAVVLAAALAACSTPPGERAPPPDSAADEGTVTIEEALAAHTDEWMRIDGVEGTGIGLCDDAPCIKIFVSRPVEELQGTLPDDVDGHPVRLEPTGRIEPR